MQLHDTCLVYCCHCSLGSCCNSDSRGCAGRVEEQHSLQEEIAKLERKKRTLRERIFDIENEIAEKRNRLMESLEKRVQQKITVTPVFTIRWSVI